MTRQEYEARRELERHYVFADPCVHPEARGKQPMDKLLWSCYLRGPDVDFSVHMGIYPSLVEARDDLLRPKDG